MVTVRPEPERALKPTANELILFHLLLTISVPDDAGIFILFRTTRL